MSLIHHLAQINIARLSAPIHDPSMASFVALLDPINAIADASPGFVWRLKAGDDGYVQAVEDPSIIINMSVWESLEALHAFTYRSNHVGVFRQRKDWFVPFGAPQVALWWVPAGTVPSVEEGRARLDLVSRDGPTSAAFTFKRPFPPPVPLET